MTRRYRRPFSRAMWLAVLLASCPVVRAQVFVNGVIEGEEQPQKFEGFSVRKEPTKFNDALEDFARYRDKKAWELAFRALETLGEAKKDGMVPAGNGFFVPSRQRILSSLTSLPPEGKQAFRLFYDAKAKQLLERAETAAKAPVELGPGAAGPVPKPGDEIAVLREIFDKYFISSVGDKAADRLGDALFESGDFAFAAVTWGSVLKEFPDTSIPRLRLHVKRCTALARAGQWELFDENLREVRSKFAGERLVIGGKEVEAAEHLASLRQSLASTRPTTSPALANVDLGPLTLPRDDKPLWQIKLVDETINKKLEAAMNNNNWGAQFSGLRGAVPATTTDGKRIYVNWLGVVFAADVATGKMLWRNRKFSELANRFQEFVNQLADVDVYTTTLLGDTLYVTGINLDRIGNHQEPVRLVSMNTADGKVKWSSTSGALSNWNFIGAPKFSPGGDIIYATARQRNSMDVSLLAIGPAKGELLWQVLLGTAQGSSNYRGETDPPMPVIVLGSGGGAMFIVTNNGAVVAVDPAARRLEWAFNYEGAPIRNQEHMWGWGRRMMTDTKMGPAAFLDGTTLYIKEEGASAVYAVDITTPALLWKRPLDSENSLMPLGNGRMLSVGQELGVIDTKSSRRPLTWSTPLPPLSSRLTPMVSENRLLAFAPRGVYEIDLASGDTMRIFRGADREALGGTLRRVPGRLICVSNLAITAYPTADDATARQAASR